MKEQAGAQRAAIDQLFRFWIDGQLSLRFTAVFIQFNGGQYSAEFCLERFSDLGFILGEMFVLLSIRVDEQLLLHVHHSFTAESAVGEILDRYRIAENLHGLPLALP